MIKDDRLIQLIKSGEPNIRSTKRGESMSKDNLLEILQNNGDLNDVKPKSIMTLKEEIRKDLTISLLLNLT